MNNKGFLFTILTFLLALSALVLASFFAMQKTPVDVSVEKTMNVFDDAKTDIEDILQLSASVERSNGSVTVFFWDHIPLANGIDTMNRYENFIEENYSTGINSNITMTGIADSNFTIEPYGLIYGYPNYNKREIRVYNEGGDVDGIEKYIIELNFDENLEGIINYSAPGTLEVEINATFANAFYNETISVARNGNTTWIFNFGDSNVTLKIGRNTIDAQSRDSSMIANVTGTTEGDITTSVVLTDVNETVGVKSSIYLSVKDKVTKQDYIWLVKG